MIDIEAIHARMVARTSTWDQREEDLCRLLDEVKRLRAEVAEHLEVRRAYAEVILDRTLAEAGYGSDPRRALTAADMDAEFKKAVTD
jgi:hypothetical protein